MNRLMNTLVAAGCLIAIPCAMADGTISGKITFDGKMASPKKIRIKGDAFCVKAHPKGSDLVKESYLFNKDKGTLLNVVVYISEGADETSSGAAMEDATIDQKGCQYVPHMTAVMVGQTLNINNTDETAHNLNLKPEINNGFNEGQPVANMTKTVTFDKVEVGMPLKCDVHSWMNAYISVFENPYFAVVDENGEFTIENVPAGNYTLKTWHEFSKFKPTVEDMKIEVKDGESTTADFTYSPPKKK